MKEEKRMQYFYLAVCKGGLLLIALSIMRALSIHQDSLGYWLGFVGFLCVVAHMRFLEKKWGMSKKYQFLSFGVFVVAFLPLAYWISFPQ